MFRLNFTLRHNVKSLARRLLFFGNFAVSGNSFDYNFWTSGLLEILNSWHWCRWQAQRSVNNKGVYEFNTQPTSESCLSRMFHSFLLIIWLPKFSYVLVYDRRDRRCAAGCRRGIPKSSVNRRVFLLSCFRYLMLIISILVWSALMEWWRTFGCLWFNNVNPFS